MKTLWYISIVVLIINFYLTSAVNLNATIELLTHRTVSDSCVTNEGLTGSCITSSKCSSLRGVAKGYCSSLRVCCDSK